ncbi:MAG TPA: Asp-tRNA(Asn)/Glu-tRNA(Gln) amidotransferase subunit GatC [Candidatus Binatia bacterium]|jgi:aspartyl-tRNA(Asn)/glutamyl-tRNA(Gln) amidotransferase subunit C
MKLSTEQLRKVALLARLRLSPEEESSLAMELDAILGYMDKLNQLNTDDVEPFKHAITAPNPLREDRVTNRPGTESLLANAPDRDGTFFKVPKIIE